MSGAKIDVMYGHVEGGAGAFARDPSGYLSIEAGIFQKHGLDVSWNHVQGTEERYRRLANGGAHVSLVVGRASLQHFLSTESTVVLGCVMNSCPYFLVAEPESAELPKLRGKTVACREAPSRHTPLRDSLRKAAGLNVAEELSLQLPTSDQEVYELLITGRVHAALLPRPYAFWAEERGWRRISSWSGIVDDPLPITIETTVKLWRERGAELEAFLRAHREGVANFKSHRDDAVRILRDKFGHSAAYAAKTMDDYVVCMNEALRVDWNKLELLVAQVAPQTPGGAKDLAARWLMPGSLETAG
jgi:ABC-type nitrate/sulfonate/bicarbonate transport system substrate-binding protein